MLDHNLTVLTPDNVPERAKRVERAERRAELAAILAVGFLRLRARVRAHEEEAARREISPPDGDPGGKRRTSCTMFSRRNRVCLGPHNALKTPLT